MRRTSLAPASMRTTSGRTPGKVAPSVLVAQLQALSARPELLRRPEFAETCIWIQRAAALLPQEAAESALGCAARQPAREVAPKPSRKSFIPAPPTRRVITFPPRDEQAGGQSAIASPPPPPPPEPPPPPPPVAAPTEPPDSLHLAPEQMAAAPEPTPVGKAAAAMPSSRGQPAAASPRRSSAKRSSSTSSSSLHTPFEIEAIKTQPRSMRLGRSSASPRTPSLASPPKSVRRQARHERSALRGRSLDSDASSALDLTPCFSPQPPKSIRRVHGNDAAAALVDDAASPILVPPSPPRSLKRAPPPAARPAPASPPAPPAAATPTRALRNTPARQARRDSPHPATPRSGARRGRGATPTRRTPGRAGAAGAAPQPPREAAPDEREAAPAPVPAAVAGDAGRGLDLVPFPATFQHGAGAEQLQLLHATLRDASAPLSLDALAAALPAAKFTPARLTLLLEVMQSRRVVTLHTDSRGARWALRG